MHVTRSIFRTPMLLLAICSWLLLQAPLSFAQEDKRPLIVAKVTIYGLKKILPEQLESCIHTKSGCEFSDDTARQDMKRLADSRLCKPIDLRTERTDDGRIDVIFNIAEYPNTVRAIEFRHAKHVSAKELENLTQLQVGMPLDKHRNMRACFDIQEHLQNLGYFFANVTLEEGFDHTHDRIIFNITEGPVVRVRRVEMVGAKYLPIAPLLQKYEESSKHFFGVHEGKYHPQVVFDGLVKLTEHYRNHGYLDVHVSRELSFSDDFQFADVTFHIQEGVRYRVHDWTVEGTKTIPREQLASIIMLKKGAHYNEADVKKDVNNIVDYGNWRGAYLKVKSLYDEVPGNPGLVRVHFVVEEKEIPYVGGNLIILGKQQKNPTHYIGQVIIVGNTITRDDVIRKQIGLYPGQVLDYDELHRAEQRLRKLGIFENNAGTSPTVTVVDSPGNIKDIQVKVTESRTGSLYFGVGLNSKGQVMIQCVLEERNFDPWRWPTSMVDIRENRAFRGAGQQVRLQLLQIPLNSRLRAAVPPRANGNTNHESTKIENTK
jgi:outer membrane protein insertion porin family